MTEGSSEVSLAVDYANNPIVRALVRLIPHGLGSAADVLIVHRADQIKRERTRAFFDELEAGHFELTQELIESNDFMHSLDSTMRAAFRTRRAEKIHMFARLLKRGAAEQQAQSPDDYEELVGLLDDLSYREWQALLLFQQHLDTSTSNSNPLARVSPIWPAFADDLETRLGVPKDEASSFMIRIARTGLFNEITGAYFDYGGGLGITTVRFSRFRRLVEEW